MNADQTSKASLLACRDELAARFEAQQKTVSLRVDLCPALAEVVQNIFDVENASDRDVNDFVSFAGRFAELAKSDLRDRALIRGGMAFIFCNTTPNEHDMFLIQRGNPSVKTSAKDTKKVRDTWAFMTYKRTLLADRDRSYTSKSGQNMRIEFRDALLHAFEFAMGNWDAFEDSARIARAAQLGIASQNNLSSMPTNETTLVDFSELVSENYPDGTMVPFGASFTKSWTIRNAGNTPWIGRSLKRMTPRTPLFPHTVEMTAVPTTMPGETATISVEVAATRLSGFTQLRFKMVNNQGELCWPRLYPYGLGLVIETRDMVWIQRRPGADHVLWQQ